MSSTPTDKAKTKTYLAASSSATPREGLSSISISPGFLPTSPVAFLKPSACIKSFLPPLLPFAEL